MNTREMFQTIIEDNVLIIELLTRASSVVDSGLLDDLDAVREKLRSGQIRSVVVDLGQVAYFGSNMLESLRGLWNDLTPHQGKMVICNASEVGREILLIAKFDHIWPIVATREEALKLVRA